jgi:hypothetical protein
MALANRRMLPLNFEMRCYLSVNAISFTVSIKSSRLKYAKEAENFKNGPAADGAVSLNGSLLPACERGTGG